MISNFRRSISNVDLITNPSKYEETFDLFSSNAFELYKTILKDISAILPSDITVLKIIPDNELYYIPFELLLASQSEADLYKKLNYLGLKYNISYSESTEYLFDPKDEMFDQNYTVIAPDYTASGTDLGQLPFSYKSASGINKQLNGTMISTDTKAKSFLFTEPSTRIFHFAGHAGITEDPALSNLMLSDGAIYRAEIYESKIENQLTLLSACNTGNGEFMNGRGLQSLSRAFRFSGAKSTIQSLWPVPDLQTSKINEKIISNLESGINIQEVLQEAKFDLLNESPKLYSHPFYWAGFVSFGSTDQAVSLKSDTDYLYWVIWLLIAIGLISLAPFHFRKM